MLPKSMNIAAWSDLNGKPLCAIQGVSYNKQVQEKDGAQVSAFTGTAEALTALKQGRCIGFLYDDTAIQGILLKPEWSDYTMPLESQDAIPGVSRSARANRNGPRYDEGGRRLGEGRDDPEAGNPVPHQPLEIRRGTAREVQQVGLVAGVDSDGFCRLVQAALHYDWDQPRSCTIRSTARASCTGSW